MNFRALNTTIVSPRGFLTHLPTGGSSAQVAAGSIWGRDDLVGLRQYASVIVEPVALASAQADREADLPQEEHQVASGEPDDPGAGLDPDERHALTVVMLLVAGVPVATRGLPDQVRALIDDDLLTLADTVTIEQVGDSGRREVLSLALRRRAWAATRPPVMQDPADSAILAVLPAGDLPDHLHQDLAAQTWPAVRIVTEDEADLEALVAQEVERGAVYITRLDAGLRYGPHHLEDLVHALQHSRARVVHSPARFETIGNGHWLERDDGRSESEGSAGLPGGSLWYAADGPALPQPDRRDYLVNGTNAVPAAAMGGTAHLVESGALPPAPSRLHRDRPPVLDWLGRDESNNPAAGPSAAGLPRSYFAAAGTGAPSRLRNSATARES